MVIATELTPKPIHSPHTTEEAPTQNERDCREKPKTQYKLGIHSFLEPPENCHAIEVPFGCTDSSAADIQQRRRLPIARLKSANVEINFKHPVYSVRLFKKRVVQHIRMHIERPKLVENSGPVRVLLKKRPGHCKVVQQYQAH